MPCCSNKTLNNHCRKCSSGKTQKLPWLAGWKVSEVGLGLKDTQAPGKANF